MARRMRCASPPERVAAERARLRYPRPTASRKSMRSATSPSGRAAISFWRGVSCRKNLVHGGTRRGQRKAGEICNRPSGEFHRQRFGAQPLAVAHVAKRRRHVLRHPLAIRVGTGLFKIALEKFQNALKPKPFVGLAFRLRRHLRWICCRERRSAGNRTESGSAF